MDFFLSLTESPSGDRKITNSVTPFVHSTWERNGIKGVGKSINSIRLSKKFCVFCKKLTVKLLCSVAFKRDLQILISENANSACREVAVDVVENLQSDGKYATSYKVYCLLQAVCRFPGKFKVVSSCNLPWLIPFLHSETVTRVNGPCSF